MSNYKDTGNSRQRLLSAGPMLPRPCWKKDILLLSKKLSLNISDRDCPAYVAREKLTPAEAVRLIAEVRGLPVLAHPFTTANPEDDGKGIKTARAGGDGSLLCRLPARGNKQSYSTWRKNTTLSLPAAPTITALTTLRKLPSAALMSRCSFVEKLIALAEQRRLKTS